MHFTILFISNIVNVVNLSTKKEGYMKQTKDLLQGNITKQLISLMIPLILGNILQQFYNTIDSIIVGRYIGNTAFAAVGVAGSVMNLFIFMLNGG